MWLDPVLLSPVHLIDDISGWLLSKVTLLLDPIFRKRFVRAAASHETIAGSGIVNPSPR